METKLDRADLLALLKGVVPNWGAMDNPLVKKAGCISAIMGIAVGIA